MMLGTLTPGQCGTDGCHASLMPLKMMLSGNRTRSVLAAEEPPSIDEAIADAAWRIAMDEEMASITENNTWEMSSLPRGHKAIGPKMGLQGET
jgi:hypothetical protein